MNKPIDPSSPTREQLRRWRRYLAEERDEARIYRELGLRRSGLDCEILLNLAKAEGRHEAHWLRLLGKHAEPAPKSSWQVRILQNLAIRIGSIFVLALMQRSEERGTYDVDADATAQMAADEHLHSEVVRALAANSRARFSGKARAMIFGINDGLVSNLALVAGIAGSGVNRGLIVLTGFTGLMAGALSMAVGEYISVTTQRELLESSLPNPQMRERLPMLDRAANELQLLFLARGEDLETATQHARAIMSSLDLPEQIKPQISLNKDSHTIKNATTSDDSRIDGQEISIKNPKVSQCTPGDDIAAATDSLDTIGSGWQAAAFSFTSFSIGALVPVLPFLFGLDGWMGIISATLAVAIILLFIGGTMGILAGKPPWLRALRQAALGFGAATVTYLLGNLASNVQFF